jgi:hypothetical protein
VVLAQTFPTTFERPFLFALLLVAACLTASWKVNLPISLASGSTLSVSCAAKLMALLLLGPQQAVIIAVAGAITQCRYDQRRPYPLYRTAFSAAAEAVAMSATALVYVWLGGNIVLADIVRAGQAAGRRDRDLFPARHGARRCRHCRDHRPDDG